MTITALILAAWFVVSVVSAFIIGKAIRIADRNDHPTTRDRKELP